MQGNSSKGGIKMGSSNLVHFMCVCVGVYVCWGVYSQEFAVKNGFHLSLCAGVFCPFVSMCAWVRGGCQ